MNSKSKRFVFKITCAKMFYVIIFLRMLGIHVYIFMRLTVRQYAIDIWIETN